MRERFEFDPAHTILGFSAKHLAVTTVRGRFQKFSGWMEGNLDAPSDVSGELTAEVASITTGVEMRDDDLRSPNFFDAEQYPTLSFRLTGAEKVDDQTYRLHGNLTIRGATRPLTLTATVEGETPNPFGPGRRVGATATGQLNRIDYGLNWDGLAGTVPLAGHNIKLEIDAELVVTPIGAEAATGA